MVSFKQYLVIAIVIDMIYWITNGHIQWITIFDLVSLKITNCQLFEFALCITMAP